MPKAVRISLLVLIILCLFAFPVWIELIRLYVPKWFKPYFAAIVLLLLLCPILAHLKEAKNKYVYATIDFAAKTALWYPNAIHELYRGSLGAHVYRLLSFCVIVVGLTVASFAVLAVLLRDVPNMPGAVFIPICAAVFVYLFTGILVR